MANNHINEVTFVTVLWVCLTISSFFVFIRLSLQYHLNRSLSATDILVLAAWLLYLSNAILWSAIYKQMFPMMALGESTLDISDIPGNIAWVEKRYLRGQLAGYLISFLALWLIKLSFVFFFRKLGNRYRAQRILWWAALVFVIACYGGVMGVLDYSCLMSSLKDSIAVCQNAHAIWYERVSLKVATAMDIISDAAIILLSGNVMWRVQINLSRKLALIGISLLTAFIIIIALVRLLLSVSGTGILNPAWLAMWNAIEICVAIMVACLASFWTFYTKSKRSRSDGCECDRFSPNRRYACLERPILLVERSVAGVKSHPSAVSVGSKSSTRDICPTR
ncbi:hypothetical protein BO94DRAFT_615638 [Aspergillus sclerotioniger CBS 115572]|uniref:Rhodopsin domain-containing protein n=1 Tax=Aspergillus sclerotioniger CBS 115572 TaxID=1450535 RepID=A0A317X350_9EURO|nr:hypothetical protein BO94DRAFT_615638 [Aspergillus sclerotioniger CBS 115572]PWY92983.1 hypothetical protein BO94DRAFT_615638 [Aspergillus sclerotioniger CBS 115572]